jgi:hypothetical protein
VKVGAGMNRRRQPRPTPDARTIRSGRPHRPARATRDVDLRRTAPRWRTRAVPVAQRPRQEMIAPATTAALPGSGEIAAPPPLALPQSYHRVPVRAGSACAAHGAVRGGGTGQPPRW